MDSSSSFDSFPHYVLLFFYLIQFFISPTPAAVATVIDTRLALLSFKSELTDPLHSLASWDNKSLNHCVWRGVTCSQRHPQSVVALNLGSLGLAGTISPSISNLTILRSLNLPNNKLTGPIPEELGRLSQLRYLNLSANSLEGEIPSTLSHCSNLQIIALGGNVLTGGIPPSLRNCTSLANLDLRSNNLTGGIPQFSTNPSLLFHLNLQSNSLTGELPPSLGNLSSLQYLVLGSNGFEGSIPESLGLIRTLQVFEVSANNLSNAIPSSFYNLSAITYIGMGGNRLSGPLSREMGAAYPNLRTLVMAQNQFEGPIPVSLPNASRLGGIYLQQNFFTGEVSPNFGSLANLQFLVLGVNRLEGHEWGFIDSLANCSLLVRLYLDDNKLEGELPGSLGNLSTSLEMLDLANNGITGTIPAEIGKLVSLTSLGLYQNFFVGSIPVAFGELRNLEKLDVSNNQLTGLIPSFIGNLTQLNQVYMEGNQLSGAIPESIGECKSLASLDLSYNALGGSIPRELLSLSSLSQYLDLSHNSLIGSIPMEVSHLNNLGILDLSENKLSGNIPSTIGTCRLLEQLNMEGNFFEGSIPQSFTDLKGLKELDLSRNKLSGEIPSFFEGFHFLRSLNLSFNDFDGEVPNGGVFSNASEISLLGNKKLCGGNPKLQLVPCSINSPKRTQFSHRKLIIGIVIGTTVIFLLSLFGILYKRKKRRGPLQASSFKGDTFVKISYADLHRATDGFSPVNLVGTGSFGSVYKGASDIEEKFFAVKVLNLQRKGASRSFIAECEALRSIRHRNLVKIVTACSSLDSKGDDFKALVFEYMPNGSLEQWLHPESGVEGGNLRKLVLSQRLNIVIDVASAMDYLHHSCEPPVVHCDLKPSNILLDNDMTAHVGDFGLARLLSKSIPTASTSSIDSSMAIKGTVGYVAPEYGMGGGVSTQADVYSFGVLLLEMMTGKRPTGDMFKDGLDLRSYIETAVLAQDVAKIVDSELVSWDGVDDNNTAEGRARGMRCILSLVRIGLACSNNSPKERMEMRDVVAEVHAIKGQFSNVESHGRGGETLQ